MEAQNVLSMKAAKRFVLGGKATITITNGRGDHFTYRIKKWHPKKKDSGFRELDKTVTKWFVGVLTNPDNERNYSDLGELNPRTFELFQPDYKGRLKPYVSQNAKSFRVAVWMFAHIVREQEFRGNAAGYSIRHSGRCGRCGLKLTTPESIDTGFGPNCADALGVEWREYSVDTPTPLLDPPEARA